MTEKKTGPKPRKYASLWQSYLWRNELIEMRKRHTLRISAIDRKKSNLDAEVERMILEIMNLDTYIKLAEKQMISYGSLVPVWTWTNDIKGLKSGSLPAQLLAQIDDIGQSPTVAALWRFAGFAVFDGQAEEKNSHYNRRLKSICYNIADQFIRHQTPIYADIYYEEKEYQRRKHPQALCIDCNEPAEQYQKKVKGKLVDAWRCPLRKKDHKVKYSDAHLHNRAWRKMIKVFLKDLWLEWRQAEGLPITDPYEPEGYSLELTPVTETAEV